jgi:DNA polymerase III subunit epsilon
MYLVFDTETTGFLNRKLPANHPDQGRIVQIAAMLLDNNLDSMAAFSLLIKPDNWNIQPGAQKVHGISKELCEKHGVEIPLALSILSSLMLKAKYLVAFNLAFDKSMLEIEAELLQLSGHFNRPQENQFCVMEMTTPICKLPGKFPNSYKWPKLEEAYNYFFGRKPDNTHDALGDVKATCEVMRALHKNKLLPV